MSQKYLINNQEFAVILQGEDYNNRIELMQQMDKLVLKNKENGQVVFAAGIAEYIPGSGLSFSDVFESADNSMYQKKSELKKT